jgi:preprotein translocase subunit SecG
MYTLLLVVLILDAIALAIAVLLQAGQGGGLAALGGSGGTDSFVGGRQAVTILTKLTWWTGGIFLGLALLLSIMSSQQVAPSSVLDNQPAAPTPVQTVPLPLEQEQAAPGQTPPPEQGPGN